MSTLLDCDYHTDAEMHDIFRNRQNNEFSCLYMNIRSLVSNFTYLKNYLYSFIVKPDIIALAETKLTEVVI